MLYIIDGHNAAGRLGMWQDGNFKESLIRLVSRHKPGKAHRYELIFDGTDVQGDHYDARPRLSVLYSPREGRIASADDRIVERVRRALRRGETEMTIITDDRELADRVRALAASGVVKVSPVKEFFSARAETEGHSDRPALSPAEVARLNEELLREWNGE